MMSARVPARVAPRAARQVVRTSRSAPRRFQSTQTQSSASSASANGASSSSHFGAGVAGGVVGAALLYGIYTQTPSGKMMRTVNTTVKETNKKYEEVAAKLKEKTPSTDEAIDKIKQVCYSYVFWVPGGKQYVDTAFKDIEDIRETNRDEVDKLVSDTYKEFQQIASAGLTMEAAHKAWDALTRLGQRLATLTSNASDQILKNHPELEKKLGGPLNQLKQMGAEYGPEAKKMADETWKEISDIFKGGFTAENADKVRKLVEEKTQQLRKMGDAVWDKGLEKAKPYLDKNPRVRDLINDNKDILKSGNASELFDKIKNLATEGGDSKKLEEYIKQTVEKAKESGGKGKSWTGSLLGSSAGFGALGQFLGSSEKGAAQKVKDNIGVLSEVLKKHSDEGQKLLEETKEDLKKLLEEKAKKAQKIADAAAKDSQQ
ncbi:hypothetical protein QBC35DRAFT_495987 [Podospora australis]|uniref:Uncharacterized protein n=1 Tax=Podospora australis TaxID=1536484 RepID=A0AAN6WVY8_9PEZI|nr:hypothetical protein QBC35DRAFT_495987 [Podospora australis]